MTIEHHPLSRDFPELQERISALRQGDHHFSRLLDEYNAVDHAVYKAETGEHGVSDEHFETMKKQRALLKDQLYAMLKEPA
ncbi:MAG: GTP-binding protein [Moraxellaceae bacterium]|jgi:uncharacterized protein YdcH (DUF465 family)|nr:GTP-binding protein [Moraxellaceae bacterium]